MSKNSVTSLLGVFTGETELISWQQSPTPASPELEIQVGIKVILVTCFLQPHINDVLQLVAYSFIQHTATATLLTHSSEILFLDVHVFSHTTKINSILTRTQAP